MQAVTDTNDNTRSCIGAQNPLKLSARCMHVCSKLTQGYIVITGRRLFMSNQACPGVPVVAIGKVGVPSAKFCSNWSSFQGDILKMSVRLTTILAWQQ